MNKDTKAVETNVDVAATSTEAVATQSATEVDYEAQLAAKDAEIAKIASEKENYRKGMLKAKGKLPGDNQVDSDDSETLDEKIARKVQETVLSTREAQVQAERDAIQKASLKRIKELELALKNRSQVTSVSASGSNHDKPEVKTDDYLSPEQLNYFKSKGWSNEKIEEFKKNAKKGATGAKV